MADNPLRKLYQAGQSPWYDNIERRLFKTGEFKKLIDDYGIVGVTSNPTIFEKAVASSSEYDKQIFKLTEEGKTPQEIYDELTIADVSSAADELREIYNKTNKLDGYVSIEVLPEYARDPAKTIDYARKIFNRINKPNIMIKVPGTKEGLEAIRQLISEGINVNVTLLFSVPQYEAIAGAYIEGLRDRIKSNKDVKGIASVASVFVSRIDTKIDKMLDDVGAPDLKGKIAVSYMKMIYKRYREIFFGEEFKPLSAKGANVQRVLWASTSTKNPAYKDVKYVEELIGPDSINTMPHETVLAFADHGIVKQAVEENLDLAKSHLDDLKSSGIDLESICDQIQAEGVKKFKESFDLLIGSIEQKVKNISTTSRK